MNVFCTGAPRPCGPSLLRAVRQRVLDPVCVPGLSRSGSCRRSTGRPSSACGPRRCRRRAPYSVAAFAGAPVACRSASGNSAQPSAAVKRTVATGAFVDAGASVNASPRFFDLEVRRRARLRGGRQRAVLLRGDERAVLAGEQIAAERARLHADGISDGLAVGAGDRVAAVCQRVPRRRVSGKRRRRRERGCAAGHQARPLHSRPHAKNGNRSARAARRARLRFAWR